MAEVKLSSTRFSMLFKRSRYYFLFCILITLILFSCNDQGVETVPPIRPPSAKFTIATSTGLGGEITDSQSNVESGQSVKITATADQHYQLKSWTSDCGSFSKDDLEITITASNNCQVRAEFEKIIYSITAISKGGGSLSAGQLSREQGQTAAFTAEPQEGYQFSEWKVGEDSDCPTIEDTSNPKVTFVVVGNCSLEAVFVKAPRTITTIADEGGFLTSNGEIIETLTVDHGDEVEIIATNEDHYELKNWESSCGDFGDGQLTIMFTAEKDCTIKAVFEKVNYTITVSSTDGGSVSDEGKLSIMYGQTAILTVNHEEGYEFSGWKTSDCTTLEDTSSPKAEFIVRGDCSLEAVFTKEARKITIEENQNGKITITPSTAVDHGDEVEITATPNQYYEFKGWVGTCGDLNNDESTITITVVADCTIEAVFESTRYTITAFSSDGGSVNQEGELSKEHGQTVSFIATPEDGYTFSKWTLAEDASCPSQIDVSNINLEFNVSGDCQLQAVFERSEYTISASSTEGGIVDEPELKREYGQTVTLKAKANEGYDFSGWTLVEETECPKIDDESNPTLEFVVVGDCQLQANFTLVPRTIATSADEGGKITATRIVKDGKKVTIEVTVEKHYEFEGWEGTCGEFSSEEKSINFTVSKDCDIKALIKPRNYTITTKGSGGKLTPETIEAEYNKAITIEANPDPGYEFSKWELIGLDCPELTDPTYSIFKFQVKGDCELQAEFIFTGEFDEPPVEEETSQEEETPQEQQQTNNQESFDDTGFDTYSIPPPPGPCNEPLITKDKGIVRANRCARSEIGKFLHLDNDEDKPKYYIDNWKGNELRKRLESNGNVVLVCTTFVIDMNDLFRDNTNFNEDISGWDVSNVTDMSYMFYEARKFNQDISDWDVSNVTDMSYMFVEARKFNQPIGKWDVSSVENMSYMFIDASGFNQPIGKWDVSSVENMNGMFSGDTSFNQPLEWGDKVRKVRFMSNMFNNASDFNQPISSWDVSSVEDMSYMFNNASDFNQPISSWDVSSVEDMSYMFNNASDFNQPISSWDVTNVRACKNFYGGKSPDPSRLPPFPPDCKSRDYPDSP